MLCYNQNPNFAIHTDLRLTTYDLRLKYMKIFLAQQNYHIGNFEANTARIIEAIEAAKQQNGDLIVFSELSVCGYPPRDFLEFNDFIEQGLASIDKIRQVADTIGGLVGCPSRNQKAEGKDLFNSAYLLY